MKITVLSILILMFMAGLAMVQMDANTENQFQVLSETEMLTTQGFGACQRVVGDKDTDGVCADKACYTVASTLGVSRIKRKRVAEKYTKCKGVDPTRDCFYILDIDDDGMIDTQICAKVFQYAVSCHPLLRTRTLASVKFFVDDQDGCFDIVAVGTTS